MEGSRGAERERAWRNYCEKGCIQEAAIRKTFGSGFRRGFVCSACTEGEHQPHVLTVLPCLGGTLGLPSG